MCFAQGPQRSDAGEARTSGPSVSSQALYRWAIALPCKKKEKKVREEDTMNDALFAIIKL